MTMVTKYMVLVLLLLNMAWSTEAVAQVKVFNHKVDQPFSGSQSPDDAYRAALARAKSEVLEEAGTYLESLSVVENFVLKRDEVIALAAGIVKTTVVARKNYATDKTFGIILETRIEVDSSMVEKRMRRLLEDQALLRKYNEMQQRQRQLLAHMRQLEEQNRRLAAEETSGSQRRQLSREFAHTSAALSAADYYQKALALWHNGAYSDAPKAVEYLNKAIDLDPRAAHLYNSRAVAYLGLGRYRRARRDLTFALKYNPDYADAYNNLGSLYYRQGRYRKAVANYDKAISLQPDFYEALMNRAMCRRKQLKYEAAIDDFRRAIAMAPAAADRDGAVVRLNGIDKLCAKARTACGLGLCRALDFLHRRDLCVEDNNSREK